MTLAQNLLTGEFLTATWNPEKGRYVLPIPAWVNKDALRRLINANGAKLYEVAQDRWEYEVTDGQSGE